VPFTVEILSKSELEAIWKNKVRAEDFENYANLIGSLDVGDGFRVKPENEAHAKVIRTNFAEAAKERVKPMRDAAGVIIGHKVKGTPLLVDGAPVPEPVVVKWKTVAHDVVRKAKDGTETTSTIIDRLEALLTATTDVKPRAPRPETEQVAMVATPLQIAAKSVVLADGRTAKMRKDGSWHAPKLAIVAAAPEAPTTNGANGSADVSASGTPAAETGAEVPA
jgi:hypothetical protein